MGFFGSDGDPTPKGVVGFVFPRCRSHLQSGLASGLEKLGSLSVDWCSWENIRRGTHGARRSTVTGSAAVVSVSHDHLGSHRASDLGSVGEWAD